MSERIQCGKYSVLVSTNAEMYRYYHHFVRLDNPIIIGPQHMAVGYVTLARRSIRTGAIHSNDISFLRIAKMKKDGSPSKTEAWVEYNFSDPRVDRKGLKHFQELFVLTPQYEHFYNMQVSIGEDLYREYHNNLPDKHFSEIVIKTYLKLKADGQLRREEALMEARKQILEARTRLLGNDPIIGLPELKTKAVSPSEQEVANQRHKVKKLQANILESPRLAIDFTDFEELREEKAKLERMERALLQAP